MGCARARGSSRPRRGARRQLAAARHRRWSVLVRLAAQPRRNRHDERTGPLRGGRPTPERESSSRTDARGVLILSAILCAMRKHAHRLLVAAVLVAAGVIGGFFVFDASRAATTADAAGRDVATRVDRMITTASDVGSALQAYVAP